MKTLVKTFIVLALLFIIFGCSYRHYLGLHGPSIRLYPEQHEGLTEDEECLECHDPENGTGDPPTSHPNFTGCLKCHNDEVNAVNPIKTSHADFR
jgi:predicted CXXCH cytochrome family protein